MEDIYKYKSDTKSLKQFKQSDFIEALDYIGMFENELKMKISYAITACNEHDELDRLLLVLVNIIRKEDEIVVQCDKDNTTSEVHLVLNNYDDIIKVIEFPLNKDFASFKNNLKDNCTWRLYFSNRC